MTQLEKSFIDRAEIVFKVDPLSTTKKSSEVMARIAIAKKLHENKYTLQMIGRVLSKNHATIIHLLKKHEELIKFDKIYKTLFSLFDKTFSHRHTYISGKITGLTQSEYKDNFKRGESKIKNLGLIPINPVTLPNAHDKSWSSYMREAIGAMMICRHVFMLKGWEDSKGAVIEHELALKR